MQEMQIRVINVAIINIIIKKIEHISLILEPFQMIQMNLVWNANQDISQLKNPRYACLAFLDLIKNFQEEIIAHYV